MTWRHWLLLLAAAGLFRGVFAIASLDTLNADPDAYASIARGLAMDGVYGVQSDDQPTTPTAFRPPLYPTLLSTMVRDGTVDRRMVAATHVGLGVVTALLAAWSATRIASRIDGDRSEGPFDTDKLQKRDRRIAGIAAGFVTIDPLLLRGSTLIMTETLATFLSTLSMAVWLGGLQVFWRYPPKRSTAVTFAAAASFGLVGAAAVLCRPTFLVWVALMASLIAVASPRRGIIMMWLAVVIVIPSVIATGLWTSRNHRVMGSPIWATTHGGYTLLLANNPLFYEHLEHSGFRFGPFDRRWDASDFLRKYDRRFEFDMREPVFWRSPDIAGPSPTIETEVQDDAYAREAAIRTIQDDPRGFAWSSIVRGIRLWNVTPHAGGQADASLIVRQCSIAVFYGIVYVAFGFAVIRHRGWRRWSFVPAITLIASLTIVHAVYWSNVRMRAPAMPLMIAVAATAMMPRSAKSIPPTTSA